MTKVQFVSPYQSEVDVVALDLKFERGQIDDVSDADAELLLRSGAFVRVDDAAPESAAQVPPGAKPPQSPPPTPVPAKQDVTVGLSGAAVSAPAPGA